MRYYKLSTNKKFFIASIVFVVVAAIYIGGFFFVKGKAAGIAVLQAEATERLETSNHVSRTQNTLRNLEKEQNRLRSHFVTPEEIPGFLALLEEFAGSLGAEAEVSDVTERDEVLIVRLTVRGDFMELYNYGVFLEHLPYSVIVENFFLQSVLVDGLGQLSGLSLVDPWIANVTVRLESYIKSITDKEN